MRRAWFAALVIVASGHAPIVHAADAATAIGDLISPAIPVPPPIAAVQARDIGSLLGFDVHGPLEWATITACAPDGSGTPRTPGGIAEVNGVRYTIPCNAMVLLPGRTVNWSDFLGSAPGRESVSLVDAPRPARSTNEPVLDIRLVGNVVDGVAIAGLVTVGQTAVMKGAGYITSMDFKAGRLGVGGVPGGRDEVLLELNDPVISDSTDPAFGKGRYSTGQTLDPRFSTDQSNPMVRAATGYPMCIPRIDPDIADDPLCPMRNRPPAASPACAALGPSSASARSRSTTSQSWCSTFVMKAPPIRSDGSDSASRPDSANAAVAGPNDPDARQMAPFKVGDFITYSGTTTRLWPSSTAVGVSARVSSGDALEVISVHTVVANVGIYTAPGSLPVYVAIDRIAIGADAEAAANSSATGVAQDIKQRITLEAVVTDATAVVDLYFVDLEPGGNVPGFPRAPRLPGQESQRWLTPNAISGEAGAVDSRGFFIGGGITPQKGGRTPGRVRLHALKVNSGILTSPTRYARVVVRSLCDPGNVNATAATVPANGTITACLKRLRLDNGLYAGQYLAPIEPIFADNAVPGDPPLPRALWTMGYLVNGEGGSGQSGDSLAAGPLSPTPW